MNIGKDDKLHKIDALLKVITEKTGLKVAYYGKESDNGEDKYIWDVDFLASSIVYKNNSFEFYMSCFADNKNDTYTLYEIKNSNIKNFILSVIDILNKAKLHGSFGNIYNIKNILGEISKRTGVDFKFIGEDNEALTWDLDFGISYLKSSPLLGIQLTLCDDNGKIIDCCDNTYDARQFIVKAVDKINNIMSKPKRKNKVVDFINEAIINKKEAHMRIYNDDIWWADIERHPYGTIRFWVGYEYKDGHTNGSICTIYDHLNPVDCAADFKMKKAVKDKVLSTWNALHKEGLM